MKTLNQYIKEKTIYNESILDDEEDLIEMSQSVLIVQEINELLQRSCRLTIDNIIDNHDGTYDIIFPNMRKGTVPKMIFKKSGNLKFKINKVDGIVSYGFIKVNESMLPKSCGGIQFNNCECEFKNTSVKIFKIKDAPYSQFMPYSNYVDIGTEDVGYEPFEGCKNFTIEFDNGGRFYCEEFSRSLFKNIKLKNCMRIGAVEFEKYLKDSDPKYSNTMKEIIDMKLNVKLIEVGSILLQIK